MDLISDLPVSLPALPLSSFIGSCPTTSVELPHFPGDTPIKRGHDIPAPVVHGIGSMKHHFAAVCTVDIVPGNFGSIKLDMAMETFVTSQNTQHATGPMAFWNVCGIY